MSSTHIGILHPGEMGIAVAATIKNSGYAVCWASEGRSAESQARAKQGDLQDIGSLAQLCALCQVIISVCPPHTAEQVADAVLAQGFQGIYLDANAISPQKATRIGQKMGQFGIAFVDGGIIGGPPHERNQTWLYLSGPEASVIEPYFAGGPLETEVISDEIGKASALKMCFAAHSKGTTALLTMILGAAEKMGVRESLEAEWSRDGSDFAMRTRRQVQRVAHRKAWRFIGEMEEMVETFEAIGLPGGFHAAAADIYRRVAHFKKVPMLPGIEEILAAMIEKGGV